MKCNRSLWYSSTTSLVVSVTVDIFHRDLELEAVTAVLFTRWATKSWYQYMDVTHNEFQPRQSLAHVVIRR